MNTRDTTNDTADVEIFLRTAAEHTRVQEAFLAHAAQHLPEELPPIGWLHPICLLLYGLCACAVSLVVLTFRFYTGA